MFLFVHINMKPIKHFIDLEGIWLLYRINARFPIFEKKIREEKLKYAHNNVIELSVNSV